jgi:predicted DsbA family dithiol-disulfide isomerase
MLIEILSDTVCPWCYIGQKRLKQALALRPSITYDLQWRPFRLDPIMPVEGLDHDAYLIAKFGTLERAERNQERIRKAGAVEGIDFRFDMIQRAPNSVNSHRLIRHTQAYGLQEALVEALYRAYFLEGRDVGDIEVLADIAAMLGLNRTQTMTYLAGNIDRSQVLAEDEHARQQGVTGVPCYVIEDRYAVSGAQALEVFLQVIDLVRQEEPELAESARLATD